MRREQMKHENMKHEEKGERRVWFFMFDVSCFTPP